MKKDSKIASKNLKKIIIVIIAIILLLISYLVEKYILPPYHYRGSINYTPFEYEKLKLEAPDFSKKIGTRKILEETLPSNEGINFLMQQDLLQILPAIRLKADPYCSISISDKSDEEYFSLQYLEEFYDGIEKLIGKETVIKEINKNKIVIIQDSSSLWSKINVALFCGGSDNLNKYEVEVECSKCSSAHYCYPDKKRLKNKINCWLTKHWCPEIEKNQQILINRVIESLECK